MVTLKNKNIEICASDFEFINAIVDMIEELTINSDEFDTPFEVLEAVRKKLLKKTENASFFQDSLFS